MKGKYEVFLGFIIVFFVISMIGLLVQSFDLDNPNRATIISGLLSMVGGGIGAFGAYLVSVNQMEKSRKFDDEKRLIDLKVLKIDETIRELNELKYIINSTERHFKDILLSTKLYKENEYPSINKVHLNYESIVFVREACSMIEQIIKIINKNKWYIKTQINIDELYNERSNYCESLKKFNLLFNQIGKGNMVLSEGQYRLIQLSEKDYDKNYKVFIDIVENSINILEISIEKILYSEV